MKIYIITSRPILTDEQRKRLERLGELVIINAKNLSVSEVEQQAADAEILIAGSSGLGKFTEELLLALPKLRFVSVLTVGTDWIDLEVAKKHNLPISNIKGANAEAVAEHIWGMILSLTKKIAHYQYDLHRQQASDFTRYRGHEVYGKTIGIVGTGDIGQRVARIAKAFAMRILGTNKSGKDVNGIETSDLETVLKESDIVTLCLPLSETTHNLISKYELGIMKKGAILINCAREKLVDRRSVIEAIEAGHLSGYGVESDIVQELMVDDPYLNNPRILITPHSAFFTEEADLRSFEIAIENVEKFLSGSMQNRVA